MKLLFLLLISLGSLFAYVFEQKTEIGLFGAIYSDYHDELAAEGNSKITLKNDSFQTDAKIEFLYSKEYAQRRYLLLDELYISKEKGDYEVTLGKRVQYWGELEGFNIADIYNQKNYLKDPFDKSAKYGAWGGDITRYFDENSLEIGVKFYEEDIKLPTGTTPYAPLAFRYDKKLKLENKRYTPTLYIKTNLVNDTYLDTEASIVFLHGYDNKRSYTPLDANTLAQYAYRVNKVLLLAHAIYNDTIFKTELAYTDVIENNTMSDYTQLSAGVEHSLYGLVGQSDVTLFGEYYRYLYSDDAKLKNVDISEVYDNDLFLAMRMTFNDVRSSELQGGILQDIQNGEQVIKATFKTRLFESFILKSEYLHIDPETSGTLLSRFGRSSRFTLSIHYIF